MSYLENIGKNAKKAFENLKIVKHNINFTNNKNTFIELKGKKIVIYSTIK